ncbi:hypothetical protein NLX86_06580 [Streptomyces sp. A3M-1-3]|uniref:hypothetical protein n=1 Tax=Streptomyces sp. A3M-1-3 TaxID=2962044 RepID=UPI0020B8AB46|nr:hypothetical protein [Streptomyces sp. A3M-1-3]MCP3817812.1 hypothetical protein [Streptomyces sp. A3M-1-3]
MIARVLPTLLLTAAFLTLALLVAAVCAAHDAWQRRRDARRTERAVRPHSAHIGTAQQDAAAITHAALQEQHR